ncbi:hypothetical protein [Bacillus kwashiorkori]|uniref:hypothetical protein n=1 Tax=Bacillus kwashiorkori TaxID=1522318 RepID=UPI0007831DBD|nr:hypothetical protein [Bacillus kwashiorkori]
MTTTQVEQTNQYEWLNELDRPDVQESLTFLIQKLPDIQKSVAQLDSVIQFGQAVLQDKTTIDNMEDKLSYTPINYDTLEALVGLLGKLPVLLELVEKLEQGVEFIKAVLADKQSLDQLNESITSLPVITKAKEVAEFVHEVKERAEQEPVQHISLFTVLKWIKSPTVQNGLHYVKTALDVLEKK